MESLPKQLQDSLIIIRHQIERSVNEKDIEALKQRRMITEKHGGGWMATEIGRDYVRRLR